MDLNYWEWKFNNLNESLAFLLAILSLAVHYIVEAPLSPLYGFIIPIATAAIAIVPHELAHRQVARNSGCYSRFTLSFRGFMITFIINLLAGLFFPPFLIFTAGYTLISCAFGGRVEGITAASGPITNIIIGLISFALYRAIPLPSPVAYFLVLSAEFNSWVAFFNLIPIYPLDGEKVFRWNKVYWIILFLFSLIILAVI